MAASGHEERFPLTRLSAGSGCRKETIAGMRSNGREAWGRWAPPGPSKMRRWGEATEFALDESGEGNCGTIF
jgi:hypothetical protein